MFIVMVVFFFKQKTAYEMLRSLVGSEMCIRDRSTALSQDISIFPNPASDFIFLANWKEGNTVYIICLLYTSDAADDLLCVDLGGRRIIKKKKHDTKDHRSHTSHHPHYPYST